MTVLLATLVLSWNETTQARIGTYNQSVRKLVAERQGEGDRVGLVDMSAVTCTVSGGWIPRGRIASGIGAERRQHDQGRMQA